MAVQNARHVGLHEATTNAHQILLRCYHCGCQSSNSKFKYYDNKKRDQPRFQCRNCSKLFTLGCHGRPQGKTYTKKRNQDPKELRDLPRQCPRCSVPNQAAFKYYNNRSPSQPRFKCLSCGQQFQMHLVVEGHERHLVHTLAKPRRSRTAKEPALAPGNAVNDNSSPVDSCNSATANAMPWGVKVAPLLSDEDADLVNFIDATLNDEPENDEHEAHVENNLDTMSSNANVDVPLTLMMEDAMMIPMNEQLLEVNSAQSWACSSASWLPPCDTFNFSPCNNITPVPVPVPVPATCGDSSSSAGSPVDLFGFAPSEAFSFAAAMMDLQTTCDWNEDLEEADVENLWA